MPRAARRKKKRKSALDRLRTICLALPEAEERETWECPTFRVRDRIYAMYVEDEDDRPAFWAKAPPGNQTHLVEADPDRFFVPPYVGHKGWVGMLLDRRVTWREVAVVVERSYRMTAPKKLLNKLEPAPVSPAPRKRKLGFWGANPGFPMISMRSFRKIYSPHSRDASRKSRGDGTAN